MCCSLQVLVWQWKTGQPGWTHPPSQAKLVFNLQSCTYSFLKPHSSGNQWQFCLRWHRLASLESTTPLSFLTKVLLAGVLAGQLGTEIDTGTRRCLWWAGCKSIEGNQCGTHGVRANVFNLHSVLILQLPIWTAEYNLSPKGHQVC